MEGTILRTTSLRPGMRRERHVPVRIFVCEMAPAVAYGANRMTSIPGEPFRTWRVPSGSWHGPSAIWIAHHPAC